MTTAVTEAPARGAGARLLTTAEVALIFRVGPRTAARWAAQGLMDSVKAPGGSHWLFPETSVQRAARPAAGPPAPSPTPADDRPEGAIS
jgi:excisionase family DNA binding protein